MLRTIIELPDGTRLSSGAGTKNAVQSITVTQCVNASQELTLGSCCANMLEVKLLTPGGVFSIAAGDELTVYRQSDDGMTRKVGVFIAEKPERASANTLRLTAYDPVIRLDKDLTGWLAGLDAWPYSLYDLATMVCAECGLTIQNTELPNGDYAVPRFSGEGITGRQIMQWIGEVAGRFCRATPDGELEFAWYQPLTTHDIGVSPCKGGRIQWEAENLEITDKTLTVDDDGVGNVALASSLLSVADDDAGNVMLDFRVQLQTMMYYQNGLSFADYAVAPIRKVQLRQSAEDVGTVYPDGLEDSVNTYVITGNPLLAAADAQALLPIAQSLYTHLQGVSYTPCKVTVPANMDIRPGHTVQICDRNGRRITAYVMTKTQQGQRDTLESTGSPTRQSTTAANQRSYQALSGKVLHLRTDVDGLKAENSDSAGKLSRLEMDIAGIRGVVEVQTKNAEGLAKQLTRLEQSAEGVKLLVERVQNEGAGKIRTGMGYTFDDRGLQIAQEGMQMKNLLDNTGMYITRNGQTILQANHEGVVATDVTVRNYLIVGEHARFEDYGAGRTACFWLEG